MALAYPVRLFRKIAGLDAYVQVWLVPAWLGLGMASLMIVLLTFRWIAPLLGRPCEAGGTFLAGKPEDQRRALQIARAIELASRFAPWRSDCYPQAMVARLMLGLSGLPCTVMIGVRREGGTGKAEGHAWVKCGQTEVCGGAISANYAVIAVFSS